MSEEKPKKSGKPGIKTTEFWLTIVSHLVAVAALVLSAINPEHQWLGIVGMVQSALAQTGYSASRGKVKASEALKDS